MTPSAHERERGRGFTPARIAALAAIGLLVLGLGWIRLASGSESVSVPDGAKAGDLVLESCTYATEDGGYDADCGTLVVPENRDDPQSRLLALPVTRIKARSDHPKEPVFRLEGGPGLTNMEFKLASRFAAERDVVLVGYRGIDGSERLDCPEVDSALARSTDFLGEKSFRAYGDGLRACADRLTDDGVDVSRYGLVQQVDDLEAARKALGYERIDLLSESAGTRTALIYAWRYPDSIHRSVLVAVNPPGHFLWDDRTTDEQLARYAKLCAQDDGCADRTDDLAATVTRTAADLPDRWLFLPIDESTVRIFTFYGLMESSTAGGPLAAPVLLDAWLDADGGDASGLWLLSALGEVERMPFVWGQYAAAARLDAEAAADYFAPGSGPRGSGLGRAATAFGFGGGTLGDSWPAAAEEASYRRLRTSEVETLLVGGELDFATPPQNAREELLPYLPNGREALLPGFGHTLTFWHQQPEAGTHLINTYLDSGTVDTSYYIPQQIDFAEPLGFGGVAKIVLGSLLGLIVLAVTTLLLMWRRVHRRGRFGRKAAVALRVLAPVVVGLGGWLAAALLVLTVLPGVPLDDELLGALSIGVPVGLGLYLAWVNRAWTARTKAIGLAAAVAGALVGGWLGFGVTEDMVAVFTTIAGAALGGNLALLALDIAWDRQAHDRFAETGAVEALQARPTTG